jgi:hypothetical protein
METNLDHEPVSAAAHRHVAQWAALTWGQEVDLHEKGHPPVAAVVDNFTPDRSVLWLLVDGHAPPRKMFLAGDPIEIRAGYGGSPKAF